MEALTKVTFCHRPIPLTLHHNRPSFSRPFSSLSFRTPPPSYSSSSPSLNSSSSSMPSIKSSFSNPLLPKPKPQPQPFQPLNPFPFSLLKTTLIAAVTATALFFARFNLKPLVAAPISPPPTVETTADDAISDEEKARNLEEYLNSHPDDVQALRNLMELRIKSRKLQEAILIIDQLIRLEPNNTEWPLLKAHMHSYSGDLELAKLGFHEILSRDPLRVEAYHGLVMAASQTDSSSELKEVEKMIKGGMEMCKKEKKEKKKDDLRDFKLLLAQIRVIEGDYNDALMIYQELVKEEPRDFRPYLCQGIIYTLLRKKDEAEKNFQKYRRLVPKGHPYARYFDDNMIATKLFSQKVENERAREVQRAQ